MALFESKKETIQKKIGEMEVKAANLKEDFLKNAQQINLSNAAIDWNFEIGDCEIKYNGGVDASSHFSLANSKKDNVFVQKYTELKSQQKVQGLNDDNDKAQLQLQLKELKQKYEKMETEYINNKMKLSETLMQVKDMERENFDKTKMTAQKK